MKTVAEKGVGDHELRMFKEGKSIALCDFCPHAITKWWQALVKKQIGSLTYEVEVYKGIPHYAYQGALKEDLVLATDKWLQTVSIIMLFKTVTLRN